MSNKALATVQILDALGNPIPKIHYQVRNQKTDQHVVKGITNSKGCFYEIQRDKGTILDVYVKSLFDDGMQKIKSFTMSKDRMLVKVISPKLLIDLKTLENNGKQGGYKRKTHTVQKGDTLTSIAQQYQTTVRALENLNKLENINKISIGQIIKLPVNTPATGSKISQDKKPQPLKKQPENAKSQKSAPPKHDAKKADQSSEPGLDDYKNRALEKLNEWYEDGKKALTEAIKIEMKEDRSQDGGTPKSDATNPCKSSPQCISSGQSELIREINIRLAGFGGALPTDKFTPLTEACIKQFQRDYMGVPETGRICGGLLVALDNFYKEYPIANLMNKAKCSCGKCSGYGNNKRGIRSGLNTANEYPGLHRSLIWILKALNFYLRTEFKKEKMDVSHVESGYRCIENNLKNGRTSVNHMGMALDIHINKDGKRTKNLVDIDYIRKNIIKNKMGGLTKREIDKIYLEPKKFNDGSSGATTWIHYDLTEFNQEYKKDLFFKKNVEELNGEYFSNLISRTDEYKILSCGGSLKKENNDNNHEDELILSERDIQDIMKVTETEVIKFKNELNFSNQAAGVVDTILNRTKSGVWGTTVRDVVNARRQFSKITGPANLKPYGSVQNMPMSDVSQRIRNFVNKYLIDRSNGKKSIVGGHLNYANKYYSDEVNKKKWVDAFHDKAVKSGLIFGNGKAIHAHGTVDELNKFIPKPFKVKLPENFKGA